MYARVVDVPFQPAKLDEAVKIVNEAIVPEMRKQPGFKTQFLFTERPTGRAISLNIWETMEDLTRFETSPVYKQLMAKLGGVLAGPPSGKGYEVSVHS